ncbi:MAG: hypothetical protein NTV86_13685 [Planctomycetota bacterium]|nr:hypothetical protein [Planctomycetota bacterium]
MKAASAIAVLATVTILSGCADPGPGMKLRPGAKDGLALTMTISKATPRVGDRVKVVVTAANAGKKPIAVAAETTALVLLDVWRPAGQSWDRFKQFPEAAGTRLTVWRLEPGEVKTFELFVDITPDWPTAETLRMTARLNGRANVAAEVSLRVQPREHAGS